MAQLVRAPSPDSACEQDEPWSSHIPDAQRRIPPAGKASANQDSDGDSGIDGSVERFSHRISSTSSAYTEPCCNLPDRSVARTCAIWP
ncbi:hypothetical protein V5799_026057 [Amblyomma americanum]|uniref:Uncharacterized protein n=1 Tax=Amblyomma americanum TaxID=6943 RepID=A0AAQ4DJN9_AMBAM